ncbi:hypothetical protein [Allorhodopirellula heiligendammensis]|uniref:Uncharacterized protein n=1 Tax=Allorhodopirellula heiligendammensis TaxID=2714739 RepID=A0A5C6BHJ4_9BACT|nr:hypothetical protein [Allorhodopirellula heiligendammensis]TWU10786.1 hypothetical protein Poly21_46920 [Allorhodopirellula heiligendammensis]
MTKRPWQIATIGLFGEEPTPCWRSMQVFSNFLLKSFCAKNSSKLSENQPPLAPVASISHQCRAAKAIAPGGRPTTEMSRNRHFRGSWRQRSPYASTQTIPPPADDPRPMSAIEDRLQKFSSAIIPTVNEGFIPGKDDVRFMDTLMGTDAIACPFTRY